MVIRYLFLALLLAPGVRAADLHLVLDPPLDQGTVFCEVYRSASDFENFRLPLRVERFSLGEAPPLVVRGLPAGDAVVVVYLDVNENGRLDRNFLGIPNEPIAFSNGYRPRGPPVFHRARIVLSEETVNDIHLGLRRTLGKRGRLGVGVGMIGRSSPYAGDGGAVLQPIPAVTYVGSRIQILGPVAQIGIFGGPHLDLAVKGRYRIGAYEDNDSEVLQGLGDREDTLMAGLALKLEILYGFEIKADYLYDVLDQIGGGSAELSINRTFPVRRTRFTPYLGLQWLGEDLANHDFGVPADDATPERPAYTPGSVVQPIAGVNGSMEMTEAILVFLQLGVELLDPDITESPIVEKDVVFTGFAAITYLF